jgi:hypothetical protein
VLPIVSVMSLYILAIMNEGSEGFVIG